MFYRLPPFHPKMRNCLNTEDGVWQFSDWDVTPSGDVFTVSVPLPQRTAEDREFADMMHSHSSYGSLRRVTPFLPVELQRWLDQNTTGKWCYSCNMATDGWVLEFSFQKQDDYLLFKMSF